MPDSDVSVILGVGVTGISEIRKRLGIKPWPREGSMIPINREGSPSPPHKKSGTPPADKK
jgi:hypothetical protein